MGDRIYLGTILGTDGYYYKGVFGFGLLKVAESDGFDGTIRKLAQDDDFVYALGREPRRVYKLLKSNLSMVAESSFYGDALNALTQDDDFVYVGGQTNPKVYKLSKSNLSKVAESDDYGGTIYALTLDDDFVYVGGDTPRKVFKYEGNLYTLIGYRRVE